MKNEFKEYFDDFFKDEELKLRVFLDLKLMAVINSNKVECHLQDNL
jgi:hypothetical protein